MQGQASFFSRPGVAEAGAGAGSISPTHTPVRPGALLFAGNAARAEGSQDHAETGGGTRLCMEEAAAGLKWRQGNSAPLGLRDALPEIFLGLATVLDTDWTANRLPRQASSERPLSTVGPFLPESKASSSGNGAIHTPATLLRLTGLYYDIPDEALSWD